ncbi:hypothetical protein SAMN04487843_101344 [Methylobacterium sp. ap11]|uniref:hypothetical protein n=1 Tax=Methylobacterium sp. ap11 TaxID=1761799 RepID=UPI0008C1C390|nr:hypothetical protein [Methylobacterium sp. ap11]SEO42478.1 hypothetical protein SAMN04487843_101344 [Methylobacterium sp. ap11]
MTKVFIAAIEDGEGCGMIEVSVHATLEGATQALRKMAEREMGYDEEDLAELDADEIQELVEDDHGHTAKVEEHEVLA